MTVEEVAAMLGADGAEWAIDRLRRHAPLVGYHSKGYDDSLDRLALQGALHLRTWLMIYARAARQLNEDYPEEVDTTWDALDEVLLPLLAQSIKLPGARRGGPTPDVRRQICADVCAAIWLEFHEGGAYSERLWAACEAYWQASGQPPTSGGENLKQWQRFCATASTQLAQSF